GLTARTEADGSISLRDATGAVQLTIPAGRMWDSNYDAARVSPESNATTYELITVNGGPALRMTANSAWVHDPARVFPIMVDPTAQPPSTGSTYVQKKDTD